MSAGTYSFTLQQGEWFDLSFVWSTGEPAVPVDLTGFTGQLELGGCSNTAILTKAVTLGGATGNVSVTVTDDELVAAGVALRQNYKYRIIVEDTLLKPKVILQGTFKVVC